MGRSCENSCSVPSEKVNLMLKECDILEATVHAMKKQVAAACEFCTCVCVCVFVCVCMCVCVCVCVFVCVCVCVCGVCTVCCAHTGVYVWCVYT